MKRFGAILLALELIISSVACAQDAAAVREIEANGLAVLRNHIEEETDRQKIVVDFPTFETEDQTLKDYLEENVTKPILAMQRLGQMADDEAYAQGQTDSIRGGYTVTLPFEGVLSVEASMRNRAADAEETEETFFSAVVDLKHLRILSLEELFWEDAATVDLAIQSAVFISAEKQDILLDSISDAFSVPKPRSCLLGEHTLRVFYAAGDVSTETMYFDLSLDELPVSLAVSDLDAAFGIIGGADEPTVIDLTDETPSDETIGGSDGVSSDVFVAEPTPEDAQIGIIGGTDGPTAIFIAEPTPEPEQTVLETPQPTVTPAPEQTLDPNFALAPVVTPTPMPLAGNDAIIADVLLHGLWKQLGTDGDVYYQFTADGKLLTITVDDYEIEDGILSSDALSGTLDIGSDSAFTLRAEDGALSGYVLNRQGESVAPEEFVTPSPTPIPTPTPSPTPTPTPTPTPSPTPSPTPTPVPTPTLSPYEQALEVAPTLAALDDVRFGNVRTLEVHAAPGMNTYRTKGAQVTTDDTVRVYGVENGWALVSYTIGSSRGRMGYIETTTLKDPESVASLGLCSIPMTLTKDADATDDPLYAQGTLASLKAGDQVTLLAFMDGGWAYVQFAIEGKICRAFIQQSALMED